MIITRELVKMQILGPHPKTTKSENPGVGAQPSVF